MDPKTWEVYKITCTTNNKAYVGLTRKGVQTRFKGHNSNGFALHSSLKKYGKDSFVVETLFSGLGKEEAQRLEIESI